MADRFTNKLNAFVPLQPGDTAALAQAIGNAKHYSRRVDLIREGDRPGPVLVVLEGWACRYKILPSGTRQIVGFMMPGDCCDLHIALLAQMDHSIQTLTAALVARIDRPVMDQMMDRHPAIARAMYISQLIDEGTLRAWITSIGRRTSLERVAHLICELYLRALNVGLEVTPTFAMPLSQTVLADALGMTPVHLNRVVKQLRHAGAVTMTRGAVVISDPALLVRIAGFDESYLHRRSRLAA